MPYRLVETKRGWGVVSDGPTGTYYHSYDTSLKKATAQLRILRAIMKETELN